MAALHLPAAHCLPVPSCCISAPGLDTVLQLSTPRYNNSQSDLVGSCVSKARTLGTKLDLVGARLARIHVGGVDLQTVQRLNMCASF